MPERLPPNKPLGKLLFCVSVVSTGSIQAERLAIEQINKKGGVLGRQIKIIQEDGASDWPTFAEKARKLSEKDRVAAIFGCWTSASRKAVLPIIERNNSLLYYPTFYEGLEQSKNVIYTGQEATQQVLEALNWLAKEKKAKTFYLIGSDYIWPRTTMKIARTHIEKVLKGKVVGEEYYPLGHTQFGSLINKTKLRKPDAIFAAVVGGSNVSFYKQMKAAGVTGDKQTLLTLSVTEDELLGIGGENMKGFYSSMKYFQSLNNPNNAAFVKAFKAKYGPKAVVGDVTQAAYLGPWLWKAAVEKAGHSDSVNVATPVAALHSMFAESVARLKVALLVQARARAARFPQYSGFLDPGLNSHRVDQIELGLYQLELDRVVYLQDTNIENLLPVPVTQDGYQSQ